MSKSVFEQLSTILGSFEEAAWFENVVRLAKEWGFDQITFAVLPRSGLKFEDTFVRSTYASSWLSSYGAGQFAYIDPVVSHSMTRAAPLVWTPEVFSTAAQKSMYEEAAGYGLRSGITLPVHGPGGKRGLLCLVSDRKPGNSFQKDIEAMIPNLVLLRDVVADGARKHVDAHANRRTPKLTPREKECLEWVAIGKTAWEISTIFGVSEAVVNFHMANVRAKFNVSSSRAAVMIAVQLGIVDVIDVSSRF
ncbi:MULTISPECIES: helix-turn-helix transcriptional regulator [Paraburkholderia]|uniref:helix-turn-helix transcriptional regulator n=1 Tax=Paraburkholderia TaxID=1822464 RepID=UPI00225817B6|nr:MULTISPECIES: LuxR family transcriptional regulator [Paraburkholderia]MCX4159670.1 LuxR family transcriptional regulator [Paraburkholderia aspalathi]MDN7169067.1 LuxR family transcriptional regulator [Paraburkholderia sp. SECH2]MDQ6397555.1 LuxR family transcriptional regulator [Paraburkholderia aspalathi]